MKTISLDEAYKLATPSPLYATSTFVQSAAVNEDNFVCEAEGDDWCQASVNAALLAHAFNVLPDAINSLMKIVHHPVHSLWNQETIEDLKEGLKDIQCIANDCVNRISRLEALE